MQIAFLFGPTTLGDIYLSLLPSRFANPGNGWCLVMESYSFLPTVESYFDSNVFPVAASPKLIATYRNTVFSKFPDCLKTDDAVVAYLRQHGKHRVYAWDIVDAAAKINTDFLFPTYNGACKLTPREEGESGESYNERVTALCNSFLEGRRIKLWITRHPDPLPRVLADARFCSHVVYPYAELAAHRAIMEPPKVGLTYRWPLSASAWRASLSSRPLARDCSSM